MRIAIFDAGAVGGYFGGRLAQAGEEVVLIARGNHLQALLSTTACSPWRCVRGVSFRRTCLRALCGPGHHIAA